MKVQFLKEYVIRIYTWICLSKRCGVGYAFKAHSEAGVYAEPFDKLKTGSAEVRKRTIKYLPRINTC